MVRLGYTVLGHTHAIAVRGGTNDGWRESDRVVYGRVQLSDCC
jgi:hypothetical protein